MAIQVCNPIFVAQHSVVHRPVTEKHSVMLYLVSCLYEKARRMKTLRMPGDDVTWVSCQLLVVM